MNFKNVSRAQFSKLETGLMALESSGTILYVAKISRPILQVLFFCEVAETRLKMSATIRTAPYRCEPAFSLDNPGLGGKAEQKTSYLNMKITNFQNTIKF